MQQTQRYIPSVSDLYGTDEIELLLDEIRELEPVCCQLDDEQDFEIAGSRAGELSLSLESPLGTCTSWDSHANYKQRSGQTPLPWGVALHCDPQHLKTPTGIVRILLVLSSAACLACECSAGTVQVGLFLLPLIGRLRLMVFCAIFSLLITCLMLFLDISHIALMFPFNWTKVNTWMYLSIGLILILSSTLVMHMVLYAEEYVLVNKHTKDTLFTSAFIGYICAIESFILSGIASWPWTQYYRQVPDDGSEMYIEDREMTPMSPIESTDVPNTHHQTQYNNRNNSTAHSESNHNNQQQQQQQQQYNRISSSSSYNQKPYIPAKRPNELINQRPTLGHTQTTRKPNTRYREGYHYQPVASTSRQSPTFVLGDDIGAGPSTSRSNDNSSA
ncbi:uncharacterized protein LOC105216394 [Zeugodacus cucurbitae]|uniref:Uncharacterized protein LOC125775841 n=3 Tax=Dacini TaxID=43871 RepID=A0ABM3J0P6_BACDO|nr:uncharacterized protein LOC105216394 [Zeugodacus cucurbitae]XP_049302804.1 uncharacterized protein LOC125775841 [Bactrocera dorsalis]XP_054083431.1 uncharacterized protein LOC105216394 [Zeugodacus cucurbitae]XP_054083432.1 uncharacterized protein LOC105216394 [Zeugodacus cucurbitae]